jgi:ATP-dependent Lhr-like helicase
MSLELFHPAVRDWFESAFERPTPAQEAAWPAIAGGEPALIAAPTGSGKTLAAFLWAIDELAREAIAGRLGDETRVLYVSPLKALSHDVQKNLEAPLAGISEKLQAHGHLCPEIRAWVRTGDTPQAERERMKRKPPHILVTTPESLYILLTSESGRRMLSTVRTAIVDEIHSVASSKRGAHLALSLERLSALTGTPPVRIGLSATQKPIERIGRYLTGTEGPPCRIMDLGHARERDLALEVTGSPLSAVMSAEAMEEIYERLEQLVLEHRTTLIFVNTRRLAERAARCLADRLGEEHVTSHHGSLSRQHRLDAEQRLKGGNLRAMVATSSLELGIDIGDVDLVCQLGSPRAISAFLQRVGRSGHAVGATPKGRLFPLSRDDLVECAALLASARDGELDQIHLCEGPLDVLAQQITAEVAAREWTVDELLACFQRAWPYRDLDRDGLLRIVAMLADGFTTRRGRRGAYLHFDAVNARLRPRRGARLTAITNGGTIPDQFDYDVVMAPQGLRVGTVNEDFAFESLPGDIFQLGNTSYRILKVETGRVLVEDAKGQPPNIPFWFGEAPGRTDELSEAVSRLRRRVADWLDDDEAGAGARAAREYGLPDAAAGQLVDYLAAGCAALGTLPTLDQPVMERFFDDAGDQHLVIHSPYGSRINRAWGLALRKRFCRQFNFELQAAADEDHIVLSLGATHSFPLDEVAGYLKAASARDVLTQALLDAPVFGVRWRWNATVALAVRRMNGGKKTPPPFQRADAEDLLAVVFPDQLACLENIAGKREIPDHPLVNQTLADCLEGHMDVQGLERLLAALESRDVRVHRRDLAGPSPLAEEIINARPYAFLDDGDAEGRRTRNVRTGQFDAPADAARLGRLDPEAVHRVRSEAWPVVRDPDELHDALVTGGFLTAGEGRSWDGYFQALATERRAARLEPEGGEAIWVAAERLGEWLAVLPGTAPAPAIEPVGGGDREQDSDRALVELLRSRLEIAGPVTVDALSGPLGLPRERVEAALAALEQEGFAMRGAYTAAGAMEWCARRLLVRIHRHTIRCRRRSVEPVDAACFMRFLTRWQGLSRPGEGVDTLARVLEQLEGFPLPAGAWEREVLPARVADFEPAQLDQLTAGGRFVWLRLEPTGAATPVKSTPVALVPRERLGHWLGEAPAADSLSAAARRVHETLSQSGALFHRELAQATGLLAAQLEQALGELVARGLVTSDAFAGLRALLVGARPRGRRRGPDPMERAGRWALLKPPSVVPEQTDEPALAHCRLLLRRYGIVFKRLLAREPGLPPWRDLLYWFHRLEAQGELRGGRFVDGFSGEQFALPEAAGLLDEARRAPAGDEWLALSASDPLNLAGIITPGGRVSAQSGNRLLLRDGVPLAWQNGGEVSFAKRMQPKQEWRARTMLVRVRQQPSGAVN